MFLDPAPLETLHLLVLAASFISVFGLMWLLLHRSRPPLRRAASQRTVYYAGPVFILIAVLAALPFLPGWPLRWSLLAAAITTLLTGIADERQPLSPRAQLICQVFIALVAVAGGWSITAISHPLQNGVINLAWAHWGYFVWPGALLTVGWLVLLMNSLNWLDGADGLAAGVGLVAFITLAAVALLPSVQDSLTLTLAMVGLGALLGFWLWNFPPARVYLGTSGVWFLGLFIGLAAIIGGGKIVTTLLVLALPVLDALRVIIVRLFRRQAPWHGDRDAHFHFRLSLFGWPPRSIMLLAMAVSALLGLGALLLETKYKIAALVAAAVCLLLVSLRFLPRKPSAVAQPAAPEYNKFQYDSEISSGKH